MIFSHKNNFLLWHLFCVSILIGVYFLLSILNPPPPKKKGKKYEIIYKKLGRVLWPWAYSYLTSYRSIEFPASNGIFCPIRIRYFQLVLENFFFCYVNTFALGDFAEKCILKLVEWFSGHYRAIKSENLTQCRLQVVHFTAFWSRCKISACEVQACTERKNFEIVFGFKSDTAVLPFTFPFLSSLPFSLFLLHFFSLAGHLVCFILVGRVFRKAFWILVLQ